MDEGTLIRLASAGDERAFGILVRRHEDSVYGWIRRRVNEEETARDLAQETFLRGFRALPSFRGEAALGTWLLTIATNAVRTHNRRQRGATFVPLRPDIASAAPGPDATAVAESQRRALTRALSELPPRQRAVVEMRVYGELPYSEIARRTGSSENAAKVNFHHALKGLRRLMGESWPADPRAQEPA